MQTLLWILLILVILSLIIPLVSRAWTWGTLTVPGLLLLILLILLLIYLL